MSCLGYVNLRDVRGRVFAPLLKGPWRDAVMTEYGGEGGGSETSAIWLKLEVRCGTGCTSDESADLEPTPRAAIRLDEQAVVWPHAEVTLALERAVVLAGGVRELAADEHARRGPDRPDVLHRAKLAADEHFAADPEASLARRGRHLLP